ncbi:3-dehydroquinate synthase [Modicisalibacter ilicicola DSM 19980]|uniref:3-dehydroquinate synthase n=1 Tax=Modicisalibacter ilicicola DSM 19980 TaxID=1121942 RepID=A0A1M4X1K5_9GAMM|nr:3-dehydroquinate synthase [Halomonas ilicicola]SHE87330.1 3-dehydroquinate synthase [Halomonas ilicicola DSM 19980]
MQTNSAASLDEIPTGRAEAAPASSLSRSSEKGVEGEQRTSIHWQRFSVPFEYPVAFTRNLFSPDNPLLVEMLAWRQEAKRHRCLIYIDDGVAKAQPGLIERIQAYFATHAARMELVEAPQVVPGGEQIKICPSHLIAAQKAIHRLGVDRHSYVIAIGGGAVLDAIGFAAATAHRGVRHIRVPSTVLSQNDSGVGVKNGINFNGVKNFMGTFAPPWAVLNDLTLLETLERRERIGGIAEAIKVALIRDEAFFTWMESNVDGLRRFDPEAEETMIRRSAALHMRQIAHGGDPFELGSARPLDFGHWSAHKLETLTEHEVHHGEAVAIGIALDARYSVLAGLLAPGEELRIVGLLERLGLRVFHPQLIAPDTSGEAAILTGLREFQEHLGGELTVTLLSGIGQGVEVNAIDSELVMQSIAWLQAREDRHAAAR